MWDNTLKEMGEGAPFTTTDQVYKDLIEGNRYSTATIFNGQNASEINALVRTGESNGEYIVFAPIKVTSRDDLDLFFVINPDVTDTGTELDVTSRRIDSDPSNSTAFRNVTYTGGQQTNSVLVLAGTNKVGSSLDNKALIVPDGTDLLFSVASLQGTTNTTMGVELLWSEVDDTTIPNLNV